MINWCALKYDQTDVGSVVKADHSKCPIDSVFQAFALDNPKEKGPNRKFQCPHRDDTRNR
jgi:hypothetical protein